MINNDFTPNLHNTGKLILNMVNSHENSPAPNGQNKLPAT